MKNTYRKFLLASASFAFVSPLVMAAPSFAQSTATQQIEAVTVSATATSTGVMVPIVVPKERATIDQDFISSQPAGQSVFESLNLVPGYNFTNSDPYGNSGGNVRIHGFDGNRISFTWDGMPLNDTGNYAIFTNQVADPEIIATATVNQGSTDVDSPTASAVGGVIAIKTTRPKEEFAVVSDTSYGSYNYIREFFRVDSGAIGPWGTRAFASYSYNYYDKWKGPGYLQRRQYNAEIYQDLGDTGWISLAVHYNENRNNFYNSVTYLPSNASTQYVANAASVGGARVLTAAEATAAGLPTMGVGAPNVALTPSGSYTGVGTPPLPTTAAGYGLTWDEASLCTRPTPAAGSAQIEATSSGGTTPFCTGYYNVRINPSDTGNIRLASLFHLTDELSLTFDPSVQYVLANGGGITVLSETDPRLRGAGGAAGKDLNGDGDLLDQIQVYSPNNTNTIRYGINTSLLWQIDKDNAVQLAYTGDFGFHRQTGQMSFMDPNGNPFSVFAGYKDVGNRVLSADGTPIRTRDRRSHAFLNQVAFDYEGNFMDDALHVSAGLRLPFMERDLNQLCFVQAAGTFTQQTPGAGFQYCTSQSPSTALAANGTVTFGQLQNSATQLFTPPGTTTARYNRLLPNIGLSYFVPGTGHMVFASFAEGLSAPRTDNLYNGGASGCATPAGVPAPNQAGCVFSTFAAVKPETTNSYDIGYRYTGDNVSVSITAYNTQFKNRIVSTFDATQGISIDHNIGGVNMDGVDAGLDVRLFDALSVYTSASYEHTRVSNSPLSFIITNPATGAGVSIAGKELTETPDWTLVQRYQYKFAGFTLGVGGKFVSRRFATETNDYRLPSYVTANMDLRYDLGELGWDGSYIQFNAENLLDQKYFGSVQTLRTCFTPYVPVTSGCTTYPALVVGSPQTFQVTLRAAL